jgi:hypothetical protein
MSITIKEQLSAAISARKDSLAALRHRIIDLLDAVPVGVRLSDGQGLVVKVVSLCTGASQWDNRTWEITIKGWGLVDAQGKLIAECLDSSVWDGRNMYHRSTEPTCLGTAYDPEYADRLKWATGTETRAVAGRLPEAIARYMGACESERIANTETLA